MGQFQNILKSLRLAKNLTQDELAKQLRISRSAIGMYESGAREPDFDTLELIADFFNVDIDYLMGRTIKTTFIPHATEDSYYTNPETAKIAQEIYENKELSLLFDAAKDAAPEDLQTVHTMLLALKKKERGE